MVVAWLSEIEERDDDGNAICTGRFACTFGEEAVAELPFEAALAWAGERTDRAYADIEWERYSVGRHAFPDLPPLPSELAERIARGPRRPEVDVWRDRADDAPPVRWEIVVALSPPDLRVEARPEYERVVERVARRVDAAGCDAVAWSGDELDAGLADIDAQRRRAGEPEAFGWMTVHRLAFVLTAVAVAPAHRHLLEQVRAAVLDEVEAASGRRPYERGAVEIEDRWGVEVDVHPPGYEWRAPAL